jgi:hypothetical protein
MKLIDGLRTKLAGLFSNAEKSNKYPLREFVYLDDMSVLSLLASRFGPIPMEVTETTTSSWGREADFSAQGNLGISTIGGSGKLTKGESTGTQTVRKSVIQTLFRDLHNREKQTLAVRPMSESVKLNSFDLRKNMEELEAHGWIVDCEKLSRGKLFEIEVELEAESVFRVSSVISALWEILNESGTLFIPEKDLSQIGWVNRILERLLTGLVPIKGKAVDYGMIRVDGKDYLVHSELAKRLETEGEFKATSLYVVGVAEQKLFWKDIRRVLFSRSRFFIFGRIARSNLQPSWEPIKLAGILNSVIPDFQNHFRSMESQMVSSFLPTSSPKGNQISQELAGDALKIFARLISGHFGYEFDSEAEDQLSQIVSKYRDRFSNQEERRVAFDSVESFILGRANKTREPQAVAELREKALGQAGLDLVGPEIYKAEENHKLPDEETLNLYLDTEIIAIYW